MFSTNSYLLSSTDLQTIPNSGHESANFKTISVKSTQTSSNDTKDQGPDAKQNADDAVQVCVVADHNTDKEDQVWLLDVEGMRVITGKLWTCRRRLLF